MFIGITAKLRNGHLLQYRQRFGLTQKRAAELVGIHPSTWCAIENMRFDNGWFSWSTINKIAVALDVPADEICPEELRGQRLSVERTAYWKVEPRQLVAQGRNIAYLPSEPADAEIKEQIACELQTLTYREREIIKLRYGIGDGYAYTLEEIGKIFKITRERVRAVEARAICKLQHPTRANRLEVTCAEFLGIEPPEPAEKPSERPCGPPGAK